VALHDCAECEVLLDTDWLVGSKTVFRPEIAVVCGDNIRQYTTVTPEIIFEIVSPSTVGRDEGLKFRMYKEAGVSYYVLVYPDSLAAKVHKLEGGAFVEVALGDDRFFGFEDVTCPFNPSFDTVFRQSSR
jgi:Uma2 family endonuclease